MKFQLTRPIKLSSGDTVESLDLDFDSLSLVDIKNARKVKALICDMNGVSDNTSVSPRLDESLRIGLAWIAAMKTDKRLSINDVILLSAKDALVLSEEVLTSYLF